MTDDSVLYAETIVRELKKNRVTHTIWLPCSDTAALHRAITAESGIHSIPVCREGEAMAIAAGLWVGNRIPVVIVQNTGFFESGDSIRGIGLGAGIPMVILIGYRGYTRHGRTTDSAARFIEPILHTWQISYYLIESDADVDRISMAFEEAERTSKPVAVLIGKECLSS
jgi:sulfopyruvate decarboxylase TPP-binding subunit